MNRTRELQLQGSSAAETARASDRFRCGVGDRRYFGREGLAAAALDGSANLAVLRRGLRIGSQYLLTAPGRRTGQPRSTPISIATLDGSRYIVAAFADAAWVANVRAASAGTLSRGRVDERVTLTELPVADRGPILRAFLQQVRGGVRFFGEQTPDEIVAGADRYPVFRVEG